MLQTDFLINSFSVASSLGLITFAITGSLRLMIIKRQEGRYGDCGEKIDNQL